MPRQLLNDAFARVFVPSAPYTRYVVVHQGDVWFINFDGQEYGPYKSEREALLFAIDAAQKLGRKGDDTQVLLLDDDGHAQRTWTFGRDSYPPRH